MRDGETRTMRSLGRLTWPEVEEYLSSHPELILPVGICEQHSKHLPLNTDTIVCEYIAENLSIRTGIIIAPTIQYGVGLPCDRYFAGTTSIAAEYLNGTVNDLISIWLDQGFRTIYIITAHGDPHHVNALKSLESESVAFRDLWDIPLGDILDRQECARHAGEAETSVMLYLNPEVVRKDHMVDFSVSFDEFEPYLSHNRRGPIPGSPGGLGYPRCADPVKGERILRRMLEHAVYWMENQSR